MGREISEEKKIMCYILVNEQGLSLEETGRRLGIDGVTVSNYAIDIPSGKSRTKKLREKLRKENKTIGENIKDNLAKNGYTNTTYRMMLNKINGTTHTERNNYLARKKGFKNMYHLEKEKYKEAGINHNEKNKQGHMTRSQKKHNKELGRLITEFMKKKHLSLDELSKLTKKTEEPMSRMSLHYYSHGYNFPKVDRLKKLYEIMGIESNPILDPYLERESYESALKIEEKLKMKSFNKLERIIKK